MRLLDLCCGAGGAGQGYANAGFEVVGVDIAPQRHYPFEFVQADLLVVLADAEFLDSFDAVHGSPPCQRFSLISAVQGPAHRASLPSYLWRLRRALRDAGKPYVIENVPGAPLINPAILCGTAFGLPLVECWDGVVRQLRRHRLFETNWALAKPPPCKHSYPALGVYGHGPRKKPRSPHVTQGGYQGAAEERRVAMEVPWMTSAEATEAIPPVYTEWVGFQLLKHLERSRSALHNGMT